MTLILSTAHALRFSGQLTFSRHDDRDTQRRRGGGTGESYCAGRLVMGLKTRTRTAVLDLGPSGG